MALFRPPAVSRQTRSVGGRATFRSSFALQPTPNSPYGTRVPFTLPRCNRSLLPSPGFLEKLCQTRYWVLPQDATVSARVSRRNGEERSPRSGGNENQQTSSDHAVFIERRLRARCPARDRALQRALNSYADRFASEPHLSFEQHFFRLAATSRLAEGEERRRG